SIRILDDAFFEIQQDLSLLPIALLILDNALEHPSEVTLLMKQCIHKFSRKGKRRQYLLQRLTQERIQHRQQSRQKHTFRVFHTSRLRQEFAHASPHRTSRDDVA